MAKYKKPIGETLTPHVNNPKQKPNQFQRIFKIASITLNIYDRTKCVLWCGVM